MSSIADDITRSQFSSSATSSTSKNHRLATIVGFLPISFFIVCWYWSSSINAVATQRLLSQNDASHGEANHDASEVHSPSSMLAAVLLTAAQLVVGSMASLVLIWISKFVLPSYSIILVVVITRNRRSAPLHRLSMHQYWLRIRQCKPRSSHQTPGTD